jgi:hypothetical protein
MILDCFARYDDGPAVQGNDCDARCCDLNFGIAALALEKIAAHPKFILRPRVRRGA